MASEAGRRTLNLAVLIAALRGLNQHVKMLETQLAELDEQNTLLQDYLRQIREAAAIEYAQGLAREAIERAR